LANKDVKYGSPISRHIQLAELDGWREKAYHNSKFSYTKDGMISASRSSNSRREIRYYSSTFAFVCLVMVSLEVGMALVLNAADHGAITL